MILGMFSPALGQDLFLVSLLTSGRKDLGYKSRASGMLAPSFHI